jgi:predicted RNA binding protein with dsRBD fold (UPF0201 family)
MDIQCYEWLEHPVCQEITRYIAAETGVFELNISHAMQKILGNTLQRATVLVLLERRFAGICDVNFLNLDLQRTLGDILAQIRATIDDDYDAIGLLQHQFQAA